MAIEWLMAFQLWNVIRVYLLLLYISLPENKLNMDGNPINCYDENIVLSGILDIEMFSEISAYLWTLYSIVYWRMVKCQWLIDAGLQSKYGVKA